MPSFRRQYEGQCGSQQPKMEWINSELNSGKEIVQNFEKVLIEAATILLQVHMSCNKIVAAPYFYFNKMVVGLVIPFYSNKNKEVQQFCCSSYGPATTLLQPLSKHSDIFR